MSRSLVLGVDAGGSKTLAVLMDEEGREVTRGRGGPANFHSVGLEAMRRSVQAAIQEATGEAGQRVAVACLAMAGVDRPADREHVLAALRDWVPADRLVIGNDAEAALVGAIGRREGVVVIAGTGAIAFGVNAAGETRRASGWGHFLGDEGSGYWIGRRALQSLVRAHDGRGPATRLTGAVLDQLGLRRPEDLIGLAYGGQLGVADVAALVPAVVACQEQGDAVAVEILITAGVELGEAASAVIRGLGMAEEAVEVAMSGGVFLATRALRASFGSRVAETAPRAVTIQPRHDPAHGAALLALSLSFAGRQGFPG